MPHIIKRKMTHWTEDGACDFCGCPVMYPEDAAFEIEDMEEFLFCSKGCAAAYMHNADWEPSC